MVDDFEGCEFWLPSEFLNDDDDDDFAVKRKQRGAEEVNKNGFDLFSGTNSEMGSRTESESDEDECFNGLSSEIAKTTLQNQKVCRFSSSPKSPLCNAAGEFARRKMFQESTGLMPTRNEFSVPMEQQGMDFGFSTNLPPQLSYQQLQPINHLQFEQFRRHQMMNQTQQKRAVTNGERMPMGLPISTWPSLQRCQPKPHPGTFMRPVYLGTNLGGAKNQRAGTGVFLPRTVSSAGNASSPVMIPDRVVHALNLNLDNLGVQNQAHHQAGYHTNNGYSPNYGAALKYNNKNKKNHVMVQQKQAIAKAEMDNEEVIQLPQEWTY